MIIFQWIIGLAISAWVGAMGIGALLHTKSAKAWFGEMLAQGPVLMTISGIGYLIQALIILLNLISPMRVSSKILIWGLIAIIITQLSVLFMQIRGGAPGAALAGPIVLLILVVVYWIVKV